MRRIQGDGLALTVRWSLAASSICTVSGHRTTPCTMFERIAVRRGGLVSAADALALIYWVPTTENVLAVLPAGTDPINIKAPVPESMLKLDTVLGPKLATYRYRPERSTRN